jgi:hypothetical protein
LLTGKKGLQIFSKLFQGFPWRRSSDINGLRKNGLENAFFSSAAGMVRGVAAQGGWTKLKR